MRSNLAMEEFNTKRAETLFPEILRIYDLADNILTAVAHPGVTNREAQFEIAKPYAKEAINSTSIIAALYTEVVKKGVPVEREIQVSFEEAFQSFFDALHDAVTGMEELIIKHEHPINEAVEVRIRPMSPLAEKFLKRPLRGTEGSRIDVAKLYVYSTNGRLLLDTIDEVACHMAQLLVEFSEPDLGLTRSYEAGNPAKGITSKLARKAANLKLSDK